MVSSPQKRHAAQGVVAAGMCSQRQACRYLGLARSSWAYVSRPPKPYISDRRVICMRSVTDFRLSSEGDSLPEHQPSRKPRIGGPGPAICLARRVD
jgi:hypothetical protein